MKLLYTLTVLGLVQLVLIKPIEVSTSFENELVQFYTNEMQAIEKKFCEKIQVICWRITYFFENNKNLTDAPVMREFKQNITDFLHDFSIYMRYKYTNQLVWSFNAIKPPQSSNNKDLQFIWKLLKNYGYDQEYADYECNFLKFVKEKYLPKFEELKKHLNTHELEQHQAILQWYNELEKCQDYVCYSKHFSRFVIENPTPKKSLLQYIQAQLNYINIFYGKRAHDITMGVLYNQKLLQLSPALRENLKESLKDVDYQFANEYEIDSLRLAIHNFNNDVLIKYYYNNNIPLKDLQLLRNIFDEHGLAKLVTTYKRKLHDFVQRDLLEKFQKFKAALSQKDLAKQEPFLKWYARLKGLTTAKDIVGVLKKHFAI